MQVFDINQAPGAVRLIDQLADYIYFLNGSAGGADTTIMVRPESGGDAVYLQPGQAYKFNSGEAASRWSITNLKGQGTIVGQLLFSVGEFTDNRVSGSVEVIDGGKARTMAEVAYLSSVGFAAVAGQYSYASLWNPPASGRALVLETVYLSSTVSGALVLRPQSATVGNLYARAPSPKKIGPASRASVAKAYSGSLAANVDESIHGFNSTANTPIKFEFVEPLIILPGYGLGASGALNQDVSAVFEFFEDSL